MKINEHGIFILLILVQGCNNDNPCSAPDHDILNGYEVRSIEIPLDTTAQYYHASGQTVCKNRCLYYGFDKANDAIDIFDLDQRAFVKRIEFDNDGPNEIINPLAFQAISQDSIYIMNDYFEVYLINSDSKIINKWTIKSGLDSISEDEILLLPYTQPEMINYPFKIRNNKLYVRILWNVDLSNSNSLWKEYKNPPIAIINLSTSTINKVWGKFPYDLTKELPRDYFPPFDLTKDQPVLQFLYHPSIYINGEIICSPSAFSEGEVTKHSKDTYFEDGQNDLRPYHTDEAYVLIIYDHYRDVYYRIFQLAQPDKNSQGLLNQKLQAQFSIMVLDSAGNTISETLFEKEKYDFLNISLHKEGLLVPLENPYNPNNKEEHYQFELIKLYEKS